ncbi:WG containing repeat-containing protein [Micromonospora matsumotoense]|uniref:WG containing repeat-containing protein n=1 Tax=Micromonospora matsumotoense TaxID=121616 RepID=A0A1C4UF09_9ACTN|nr:WG repeat-containing protein [Micromonospora matsumotoense]SCE70264.1 WG containing repeat-containing protein [Micromonospora matsumotoense]
MTGGWADRWDAPPEPAWVIEPTSEWDPQFPGQRYPGDIGSQYADPRGRATTSGRAEVPPLAPTRPDGTYLGRSWADQQDDETTRRDDPHTDHDAYRRPVDEAYRRPSDEPIWQRERRQPATDRHDDRTVPDRYDDRPDADRQAGRTSWSDRRRSSAEPAPTGWHQDRSGTDRHRTGRYDTPPRQDRTAPGVTPVSPGRPPVSPAPHHEPPRHEPPRHEPPLGGRSGRFAEPGWTSEPAQAPPRRRSTGERPAADRPAADHHTTDRPAPDRPAADDGSRDRRAADGDGRARRDADGLGPDRRISADGGHDRSARPEDSYRRGAAEAGYQRPAARHDDHGRRGTEDGHTRRTADDSPGYDRYTADFAGPGRRAAEDPYRRATGGYDPFPARPERDQPTRFREDEPLRSSRREVDERPAARGHDDHRRRPLDDDRGAMSPIPEERWQHPRGRDERRPPDPREAAARSEAYPHLRSRETAAPSEPWSRSGTDRAERLRPDREPEHGRDGRQPYPRPERHPAGPARPVAPPARHDDRPAARTAPDPLGDRRTPGRPVSGTPFYGRPPGHPVSGVPVSGSPVSPAPVSSASAAPPAAPPVTGPWGPRPGPPPPQPGDRPAGARPGDVATTPVAGRPGPVPPGTPAPPADLPTRERHTDRWSSAPDPDEVAPVSAPPAARLHIEFRRPTEAAPPVDRPAAGPSTDRAAAGPPPAATTGGSGTDRTALEITPDKPRRYVPPTPEPDATDHRDTAAPRTTPGGSAAWFRPGRSTSTPATPPAPSTAPTGTASTGASAATTESVPPRAGRPTSTPLPSDVSRTEVPVPRSPAPPPAPDAGPRPAPPTGTSDEDRSATPATDIADADGRPAVADRETGFVDRATSAGPSAARPGSDRDSLPTTGRGTPPAATDAPGGTGLPPSADPVTPAGSLAVPTDVHDGNLPPRRPAVAVPADDSGPARETAPIDLAGLDAPPAGDAVPTAVPGSTLPGSTLPATPAPRGTGTRPTATGPRGTDPAGDGPATTTAGSATDRTAAVAATSAPAAPDTGAVTATGTLTGATGTAAEDGAPAATNAATGAAAGAGDPAGGTPERAVTGTRPDDAGPVATVVGEQDRTPTPDRTAFPDRATAPDRDETPDRDATPDRDETPDLDETPDEAATADREASPGRVATADRTVSPDAVPAAQEAVPTHLLQGDPEQVLAGYRWRLDPQTLREVVDDPAELRIIRGRLTEKLASSLDNRARARLLSLRAVVSRLVDDLDDAVADGRLALTYAEATGELRRTALARARLAEALRWKGEFAEADRLFTEANSTELPDLLRSALHEHAGRCCYDQGRLIEACGHFERALDLHRADDPELTDRIGVALDAVHARAVARKGFGPYPRSQEEMRHGRRSPLPTHDGQDRWGYADTDGDLVVEYRYAEAQPFHEQLAWVRRPDQAGWELIDEAGTTLLGPAYARVLPFSDGLAWVSQGGDADWSAIEPDGTVLVPGGFEEVRPFRAGVAAVRRGGWGAVDRHGRLVVAPRYHGIATMLSDGRRLDGFTDEGLAVVELAGRRGVLDRTGAVLVRPVHPALVIHPVAFLVGDGMSHWGALDRRGEPLIPPVHADWDAVVAEIDRLLADAHPVL